MTNFVNFITDKIKPAVINSYLDGPGSESEFIGSDSSTADYTKFGYLCAVYRKMLRDGSDSDDVRTLLGTVSGYVDSQNTKNYKQKSSQGYTIAEMMTYDARNDNLFKISDVTDVIGGDSFDFFVEQSRKPSSSNMGTAVHMMIEYGHDLALSELPYTSFLYYDGDSTNSEMSPFMYALKRAADENMTGVRKTTYDMIKAKILSSTSDFDEIFESNQLDTGFVQGSGVNEISKLILSSTSTVIDKVATEIASMVSGGGIDPAVMSAAVTKSSGISKAGITFDLGIYQGSAFSQKSNIGYHPLFMYVYKYKSGINVNTLDTLASVFSPYSISVKNNETDGYNVIGMVARYLAVENGSWANISLAAWLKARMSEFTGDKYKIFAASGNARDFSGGRTINAFGAINNILSTINIEHRRYFNNKDVGDPDYDPSVLMSAALPNTIDVAFYEEWMEEYGQTIE